MVIKLKILYEGLFFDSKTEELIHSLEKNRLSISNDRIHCTFVYKPQKEKLFNNLVGKEFEITLVGYGNDGRNSGFEVRLPEELKNYFLLKKPHITASIAENALPKDTANLDFKPLDKPIKIVGRFGYWIKNFDNDQQYVYFKPHFIK